MTTSMDLLGLELLVQCSRCGATVPITRPEQHARCSHCLDQAEVDEAAWSAALDNGATDFRRQGRGVLGPGKLDRPGRDVEWERGPDRPPCPSCSKPMRPTPDGAQVACASCGQSRPVEAAPAWLRAVDPAIQGVVADPAQQPAPQQRSIGLSCTGCGSSLSTDGSTRTADCPYCSTTNILPDDVWRALHPPAKRKRFWLLYRLDPDPRLIPPNLGTEARTWLILSPIAGIMAGLVIGPLLAVVLMAVSGILTTVSEDEGGMIVLSSGLAVAGLITLLGSTRALFKWLKLRPIVKPEQEVVGRLVGHADDKATIAILHPASPGAELCRVSEKLKHPLYLDLGGDGGLVRAWIIPGTTRTEVRFQPSGLV